MCPRYTVSQYLRELMSNAGENKEPDDYRKGKRKTGYHRQVSQQKAQLTTPPDCREFQVEERAQAKA